MGLDVDMMQLCKVSRALTESVCRETLQKTMDLREVQHPTRSQIQGFPRGVSHKPNGILVFSLHFQLFILPLVISKPFFAAKLGPPAYRSARGFVLYFILGNEIMPVSNPSMRLL